MEVFPQQPSSGTVQNVFGLGQSGLNTGGCLSVPPPSCRPPLPMPSSSSPRAPFPNIYVPPPFLPPMPHFPPPPQQPHFPPGALAPPSNQGIPFPLPSVCQPPPLQRVDAPAGLDFSCNGQTSVAFPMNYNVPPPSSAIPPLSSTISYQNAPPPPPPSQLPCPVSATTSNQATCMLGTIVQGQHTGNTLPICYPPVQFAGSLKPTAQNSGPEYRYSLPPSRSQEGYACLPRKQFESTVQLPRMQNNSAFATLQNYSQSLQATVTPSKQETSAARKTKGQKHDVSQESYSKESSSCHSEKDISHSQLPAKCADDFFRSGNRYSHGSSSSSCSRSSRTCSSSSSKDQNKVHASHRKSIRDAEYASYSDHHHTDRPSSRHLERSKEISSSRESRHVSRDRHHQPRSHCRDRKDISKYSRHSETNKRDIQPISVLITESGEHSPEGEPRSRHHSNVHEELDSERKDDKADERREKSYKSSSSSSSGHRSLNESQKRKRESSSERSRHSSYSHSSERSKHEKGKESETRQKESELRRQAHKKSRHGHREESSKELDKTEDVSCVQGLPPAVDLYVEDDSLVQGTEKLSEIHREFQQELLERSERVKSSKPKYEPPKRKIKLKKPKPPKGNITSECSSSSSSHESSSEEEDTALEELERKKQHPDRLHEELWYNDPGEMNDGPLCRCSAKASRSGIRHGIYAGENNIPLCDPNTNNADRLVHYRVAVTPNTNFLSKTPTRIKYEDDIYTFEGFSMFSHCPIPDLPNCKVIRFNIEYTILYEKEEFPGHFTVGGLELFSTFLFTEILELVDLNWKAHNDDSGCPRFHFMPRFVKTVKDGDQEERKLLPLAVVLQYLLDSNRLLVEEKDLAYLKSLGKDQWPELADKVKGMIVTSPGMKPSSIRIDQLDCEECNPEKKIYPLIIHFGVRPPQLSYAGNPNYQKAWRDYVKFRHLLANKPKVCYQDRHRLLKKERRLQEMRLKNNLKRDVTVVVSSQGFYKTGIMCDIVQHAMLLPVLVCHLRFHQSLDVLENKIKYKFLDRYLLQLALTHPSYRENFGTNPDHARNSLTNCGIRQPEYGDRRIHYMTTRKRGINTLINIMSRFGRQEETASRINHNERLEFLGDAVVEFLSSIHLFFMFPNLEEGGLATYRAAIVQNQHLAVLAKKLQLEKFMLYAHGSDLCHDLELKHAMANCFEALMGALFLDSGIETADRVFSETLFTEPELLDVWVNYPAHPLQEQEPGGDRKWIASVPLLQKLHEFEKAIGIEFTHIRLLARALTHRSLGYNNLTLGSNQRLEFLGDTVLQLVASEYLYKFFPEHHEGHLSLLRSSLVNNRTQAVVCDDLGMVEYAIYPYMKVELKAKDRADLLEAFLGALYVDKDLGYCTMFCEVCFFPRLQDFIMNQEWNDPKSKLQQCCLTLRTMDGGEPDIPVYKVIECKGPTNTRVYTVAVYFRGKRLAVGSGHSIQQAEMAAAESALRSSKSLFPQLDHQRRAIEKSLKQRNPSSSNASSNASASTKAPQ